MPRPGAVFTLRDRRGQILQEVLRRQYISTAALARQFGVSEVAIRRNLEQLEATGLIKRVHGGVQAMVRPGHTALYDARLWERVPEKQAVGQAAAELIRPSSTVLFDSGTTVLEVARAIPRSLLDSGSLTVITRSLVIAGELRRYRQLRLIVLGGIYAHDLDAFAGPQVESALQGLHADMLFIGTGGVSAERGLTTDNVLEVGLFRLLAGVAERAVVVTDSSKIGANKLQTLLSIGEIDSFVTDSSAPAPFVQTLRDRGIDVILARSAGQP